MAQYITAEERVWNRMKAVAAKFAKKQQTVNDQDAGVAVDGIVFQEHARDVTPEARRYFIKEFQSMVCRYAATREPETVPQSVVETPQR